MRNRIRRNATAAIQEYRCRETVPTNLRLGKKGSFKVGTRISLTNIYPDGFIGHSRSPDKKRAFWKCCYSSHLHIFCIHSMTYLKALRILKHKNLWTDVQIWNFLEFLQMKYCGEKSIVGITNNIKWASCARTMINHTPQERDSLNSSVISFLSFSGHDIKARCSLK